MAEKFVLRVKKIKSQLLMVASIQHNLREKISDNVNSEASWQNRNLVDCGDSAAFLEKYENFISDEKPKKDAKSTKLMEFVISASPEQMESDSFDFEKYFEDALKWVEGLHGKKAVLSAIVHNDEDTPHLHVHVVPINQIAASTRKRSVQVKGAAAGVREIRDFVVEAHSTLSANVVYGGPAKLSALQSDFEAKVGVRYGLHRDKAYIDGQAFGDKHVSSRQYRAMLDAEKAALDAEKQQLNIERGQLQAELSKQAHEARRLAQLDHDLGERETALTVLEDQRSDAFAVKLADLKKDRAAHADQVSRFKSAQQEFKATVDKFNANHAAWQSDVVKLQGYTADQIVSYVDKMKAAQVQPKRGR